MKILNFGSCNIDFVYSLSHIVQVGETEAARRLDVFPGGKGLNQSIAMARAGAQVFHAGCVGEDGDMLVNLLRENGVDVTYLDVVKEKSGHAIIQLSDAGENCIFLYPGSNEAVTVAQIDRVLTEFSKEDILVLQNEISHVKELVEAAHRKGMRIVLNPSPYDARLKDIDLGMLSYLILNEVEIRQITGIEEPDVALGSLSKQYPELRMVMTLGAEGSVYRCGEEEIRQSAFRAEVVDTTAAGDTFLGYFVTCVAQDVPIDEALRMASMASAIAVSRMGASPSIPARDEVLGARERIS